MKTIDIGSQPTTQDFWAEVVNTLVAGNIARVRTRTFAGPGLEGAALDSWMMDLCKSVASHISFESADDVWLIFPRAATTERA